MRINGYCLVVSAAPGGAPVLNRTENPRVGSSILPLATAGISSTVTFDACSRSCHPAVLRYLVGSLEIFRGSAPREQALRGVLVMPGFGDHPPCSNERL